MVKNWATFRYFWDYFKHVFFLLNTLVQNSGFINCCQLLELFAECSQLRDLLIYYQEVQMVVMTVTLFHVRFNRDTTEFSWGSICTVTVKAK